MDNGCCSCHISPPCSFCTERCECVECGQVFLIENSISGEKCEECESPDRSKED